MKTQKIAAIYQVIIGTGIMGIWILNFLKGEIPELQREPWRIAAHLAAEVLTGTMLLVSGLSILLGRKQRKTLYYLAFGALIYTLVASPGYFAHQGNWVAVILFMIMLGLTLAIIIMGEPHLKKLKRES